MLPVYSMRPFLTFSFYKAVVHKSLYNYPVPEKFTTPIFPGNNREFLYVKYNHTVQ